MLVILKIIHMFCLFGGGAAMMGNGLLMRKVMAAGGPPPEMVSDTMKRLGRIGLGSIVLLWVTGIWIMMINGGSPGAAFYIKLIAAAVVLGAVIMISRIAAQAEAAGTAPDLSRMKSISTVSAIAAALAVIFAVVAFN